MSVASVIVPTVLGGPPLVKLLTSLGDLPDGTEVLVVDNGSQNPETQGLGESFPGVRVIRLEQNVGYSRAINLAAREATGDALVLLNDDSVCDPGYLKAILAKLDPAAGVTMVAGVMREAKDRTLIDTAGMEIDRTLLAFDYLNGEPVGCLERGVPDPIGPSGAAAAFDRDAFLAVGGFDENLFAYLEDVDLVLRMRRDGGECRLAPDAGGVHEHSSTFQSGSARKDYLMGFGRGYMLRKWSVLTVGRLPSILVRELAICAGQAAVDRNLAGVRGRVRGLRASPAREPYPSQALHHPVPTLTSTLARRWRRRARVRAAAK
jgi:N-acetylglucosaminyl-diphospho-decaprenol L-rhamnosyltransferase